VESSGCESRPAKASQQAGSQCCHSPGDRWARSVHSKEAGREGGETWGLADVAAAWTTSRGAMFVRRPRSR